MYDIEYDKVHLIGHSLGAHISGYVGRYFKGELGRITGLDPAGPLFFTVSSNLSIWKTNAKFVDVIHTCAGILGIVEPKGHIDYYPKFGSCPQAGCEVKDIIFLCKDFWFKCIYIYYNKCALVTCSHNRAIEMYAKSIRDAHLYKAYECPYQIIKGKNQCNGSNESFQYMGDGVNSR